jgi:spore coat polysaccharide biosynthesis protein SpsF
MTTAVVVQARMGSTRLPGKVMRDLAGEPVLAHVLKRCRIIPGADVVVCAVPDEAASAPIESVARHCGVELFRGSESDVLSRHFGAARSVRANVVLRVTSDCPLIDPEICGAVLQLHRDERADYAANNMPRSFPHGLDCEVFTFRALNEAHHLAKDAYDREHVTPWLCRAPNLRRANLSSGRAELSKMRWTLDYSEDLDFLRAVFAALPDRSCARLDDVLSVLAENPEIAEINNHCQQNATA